MLKLMTKTRAACALALLLGAALPASAQAQGLAGVARARPGRVPPPVQASVVVHGNAVIYLDHTPRPEAGFWGAEAALPEPVTRPQASRPRPPGAGNPRAASHPAHPPLTARAGEHRGVVSTAAVAAQRSHAAAAQSLDPIVEPILEATAEAVGSIGGTAIGVALYPPIKVLEHVF